MYDTFSADYDRFVDWNARLAVELPFIEGQLRRVQARRVLDAACGTGMHAIALAQAGYSVVGTDLSDGMIARARQNAEAANENVDFEALGFTELADRPGGTFDALLCLGNSLPHVPDAQGLAAALANFAACLRPGGLLLLQNRNFDAVMARGERWMEPQAHREGEAEWLFLRFYDYLGDGTIHFNIITLKRQGWGAWSQQVTTTRLYPLLQADLAEALQKAGFEQIVSYGNMAGELFDADASGNLVITAWRG